MITASPGKDHVLINIVADAGPFPTALDAYADVIRGDERAPYLLELRAGHVYDQFAYKGYFVPGLGSPADFFVGLQKDAVLYTVNREEAGYAFLFQGEGGWYVAFENPDHAEDNLFAHDEHYTRNARFVLGELGLI